MQADEDRYTYIFNDFTGLGIDGFKNMAIRKPLGSCGLSNRDYSFLLVMISLGVHQYKYCLPMDEAATGSSAKVIMSSLHI